MFFYMAEQDKQGKQVNILVQLLEVERERLALVIDMYGIASKEASLQSHLVDKLVVRYMKAASREEIKELNND